jgi:hypothetical protein
MHRVPGFVGDHKETVYGDPSPGLVELAGALRIIVRWYSFSRALSP